MKTNNKKVRKEMTGAQRLKTIKILSVLCIHLFAIFAACSIAFFCTAEPEDYFLAAGNIVMALLLVTMTVIMSYQTTHCRGQYRCKICGQVHTPDEDALADMLTYGKMYCTHCGKMTNHKKLRTEECTQLSAQ